MAGNAVPDHVFEREHAVRAIEMTKLNGEDWLYDSHPGPKGGVKRATTGFLMHEGIQYPVKSLGRLAAKLSGSPTETNTNGFRKRFVELGFQLITDADNEAEKSDERQRRLAETWDRPGQAEFRRDVFKLFGARCLITGCETLMALEAAHILPVYAGGRDKPWNGIPLRADIHRLFDADALELDPRTWKVLVAKHVRGEYGEYHGLDLGPIIVASGFSEKIASALQRRAAHRPT